MSRVQSDCLNPVTGYPNRSISRAESCEHPRSRSAAEQSVWLSIHYCLGYSTIHLALGLISGDHETIQITLVGLRKGARLYNKSPCDMPRLVDHAIGSVKCNYIALL